MPSNESKSERDKRLQREKIELMQAKQRASEGDAEDTPEEEQKDEPKQYTKWQKFKNFWYYNKFKVIIGAVVLFAAGNIIYSVATKVEPDLSVMILAENYDLIDKSDELTAYFTGLAEDIDGDGTVNVIVQAVPIVDAVDNPILVQTQASNKSRFMAELQINQTVLFISNSKADEISQADTIMENFTEEYPDLAGLTEKGLYLKGTELESFLGMDMPEDVYIGIREYYDVGKKTDYFKMNYDAGRKVFEKMLETEQEK